MATLPQNLQPVPKATNATLTVAELFGDNKIIVATNAITLTLPTPVKELSRLGRAKVGASNGAVALSCTGGWFGGGNSKNISTTCYVEIEVIPVTSTSYKWAVVGEAANLAELTADQLAGIQGGTLSALNPVAGTSQIPVKATGAEIDTGTDDAKFVTCKAMKDSSFSPGKASGAEVDTGTDDDKFVTCKAIKDSSLSPTKATGVEVNTGTDDDKFVTAKAIAESNVAFLTDLPDAPAGFDYSKDGRTGGTASDLDSLPYATMSDGETAVAVDTGVATVHVWSAAETAAESDPDYIECDDDGGAATGRFQLVKLHSNMIDVSNAAAKATPVDADLLLVADSAASFKAKKSTVAEVRSVLFTADAFGGVIAGLAAKASPIDADSIVICDSADTNDAKETTIGELRSVMLASDGLGTGLAALDAKATPIDADSIVVVDSADTNNAKETTIAELRSVMLSADNFGGAIAGYAAKAVPIDADSVAICDSADTNDAKETTIAELKAVFLSSANVGAAIAGYDAKATPIAADSVAICDSAAANAAKETTVAELGAVILGTDPLGTAIAALAAKASPIDADSIVVCDSADTNDAKETTIGELRTVLLASDPLGTAIAALDAKATPVDADSFLLVDSADTNNAKEITFAQLKTMLAVTVGTYTPSIALTGGAAATVTAEVYQHKTFYDWCEWTADIAGTDGGGATTLTLDFDAARVPADVNAKIPINAQVSVGGGAFTNVVGTLDCEAAADGDRHLVVAVGTLTDDAAFRIILSGAHKITPA